MYYIVSIVITLMLRYTLCQRDHPADISDVPINYTNPLRIHISSFISKNINETLETRNRLREKEGINVSFDNDIDMKFNKIKYLASGVEDYDAVNHMQLDMLNADVQWLKKDKLRYLTIKDELKFTDRPDNSEIIHLRTIKNYDIVLHYEIWFRVKTLVKYGNISVNWFPSKNIPSAIVFLRTFEDTNAPYIVQPIQQIMLILTDVDGFLQKFAPTYFLSIIYLKDE